jgi:hypothetical protein
VPCEAFEELHGASNGSMSVVDGSLMNSRTLLALMLCSGSTWIEEDDESLDAVCEPFSRIALTPII